MSQESPPRLTCLGKATLLLLAGVAFGALFYGLFRFVNFATPGRSTITSSSTDASSSPNSSSSAGSVASTAPAASADHQAPAKSGSVEFGIAYGTEKERWLKWAVAEYAKSEAGAGVTVNLIPMGSLEGAQAVLAEDKRIHVWSPASAAYTDVFEEEWKSKFEGEPILRTDALALSPMVFVMWEERYQAFAAKYGTMSFATLGQALAEKTGWAGIAGKPEWGLFKLGHTHPNESNSGMVTLVLMAYAFHQKCQGLELADILDLNFQNQMTSFERAVSGLPNSTGNLMRDMVLKGPSAYDAVVVYESVAIDYLANAEGRWGKLRIAYPSLNMWNENPYYVLNVPWSSPQQREAAGKFLDFLMTEPIQREALVHGFRPGNPSVPIRVAGSPFEKYAAFGLQVDIANACQAPRAEVLNNLLASWQRAQGSR